jgi:hypothetical protein
MQVYVAYLSIGLMICDLKLFFTAATTLSLEHER